MTFSNDWNNTFEANPAITDNASDGANQINIIRKSARERLNVDHEVSDQAEDVGSSAQISNGDSGYHRQITLKELIANPSNVSNYLRLFSKQEVSKQEVFTIDEGGVVNRLIDSAINWKNKVVVATIANGTITTAFVTSQVIDGITLLTGDRILIKNQNTASENGIYTVNVSGSPTRAVDADTGNKLVGSTIFVEKGAINGAGFFFLQTVGPITPGSTSLVFASFAISITNQATAEAGINNTEVMTPLRTKQQVEVFPYATLNAAAITGTIQTPSQLIIDDIGTQLNVDIDGGSIDGVAIGNTAAGTIKGTTIDATSTITAAGITSTGNVQADINFVGKSGQTMNLLSQGTNTAILLRALGTGDITLDAGTTGKIRPQQDIVMLNGKGIDFSAKSNSSTGTNQNNILDDYEEGTWDPNLGKGAGYVYSTFGRYVKIGKIVTVVFSVSITTMGTGDSAFVLSGLPFASTSDFVTNAGSVGFYSNLNTAVISLHPAIPASSAGIKFYGVNASNTGTDNSHNVFKDTTSISGTITYKTA